MYYITSLAKFGNCCSMVWVHRQGQWKGKNFSLSFRGGSKKVACCFTVYFWTDFLSPHTTIVSGVENYPSPSMSCCSDDLALLLPCLVLCRLKLNLVGKPVFFFLMSKSVHNEIPRDSARTSRPVPAIASFPGCSRLQFLVFAYNMLVSCPDPPLHMRERGSGVLGSL